jgi:hypothetical protein
MNQLQNNRGEGGVGLFGLMFLVLFAFKLGGIIDWSWWLVTAPLWGGCTMILVLVTIAAVIAVKNGR